MFPAHSIWATCLQAALDVMPEYSFEQLERGFYLNDWRNHGRITPIRSDSNRQVELAVHPYEYGGATYNDAQALLNQGAEHRASLYRLLQNPVDPSPSWAFVTIYYWGLFTALAWSRLAGAAIVYLDAPALSPLFAGTGRLGAGGAYFFKCGEFQGTSQRIVRLKKCSHSHFHEAVWSFLASDMQMRIASIKSEEKTMDQDIELETRLFQCLAHDHFKEAHVWPSLLRNAINYRPGFTYTEVDGPSTLDICRYLREFRMSSISEIVETYRELIRRLKNMGNSLNPVEVCNEASKLLLLKTLLLSELCESILDEISVPALMQGTGRESRVNFLRKQDIPSQPALWPMLQT
jgi:hypothetical protein